MMDDLVSRGGLIEKLFPDGIDDLDYSIDAQNVFDAIISAEASNIPMLEMAEKYPLSFLGLSPRVYNPLTKSKYYVFETVADLLALSPEELGQVRNIGEKAIEEIQIKLNQFIEEHKA